MDDKSGQSDDLGLSSTPMAIADPLFPGRWAPAVFIPSPRASKREPGTLILEMMLKLTPVEALRHARRKAILLEES